MPKKVIQYSESLKKTDPKLYAKEQAFQHAPINWIPAFVLISTPILAAVLVPWYLWTHNVGVGTWAAFAFLMAWTGLSITAGYHRLLAHRTYQAHPFVQYFLLYGATLSIQSSAFDWCSGHRRHHRYVDDEYEDPYSARRGFWFSHFGWMLKNYPSGIHNFKNIPDLTKQKVLQNQHKYYGLWIIVTNGLILTLLGWLTNDMLGVFILAGLLRLVLTHHFTFFINSLCHMFGSRPYTDTNTARDNFFLAIFTWGEGYHNYHHFFQYDYRNGIKWWQYDPTKWLIALLYKMGLATNLKTVDDTTIEYAQVQMQFKQAHLNIEKMSKINQSNTTLSINSELNNFKNKVSAEYDAFNETINEWKALKKQAIEMKKNEFSEKLHEVDDLLKEKHKNIELKIKAHSNNLEAVINQFRQKTA